MSLLEYVYLLLLDMITGFDNSDFILKVRPMPVSADIF